MRTTDDFRRANNISNVSRVPTKAEYKRRASLSFVCLSFKNRGVCIFFWCKSKRRFSKKYIFHWWCLPLTRKNLLARDKHTKKKEKKGEREKSRGGYFFLRRLLSRDDEILLFVSAFQHHRRERKSEIFLQPHKCKRRKKEEKTGLIRPLVLACNHLTSSRHVLRSVVRTNTKLRDAEDTQKARTREQET